MATARRSVSRRSFLSVSAAVPIAAVVGPPPGEPQLYAVIISGASSRHPEGGERIAAIVPLERAERIAADYNRLTMGSGFVASVRGVAWRLEGGAL